MWFKSRFLKSAKSQHNPLSVDICDQHMYLTSWCKSPSNPNKKILEPEPGLVLTLSNWYKTSSNLDVHLPEPGHLHFVQVHFTTDKIRPGSTKICFSGT